MLYDSFQFIHKLIYGERSQNGGNLWGGRISWLEKLSKGAFWGAAGVFISTGPTGLYTHGKNSLSLEL